MIPCEKHRIPNLLVCSFDVCTRDGDNLIVCNLAVFASPQLAERWLKDNLKTEGLSGHGDALANLVIASHMVTLLCRHSLAVGWQEVEVVCGSP